MRKKQSVAVYTLGCKLNQAETEEISRKLIKSGYSITDWDKADICILNTCTVTHIADRKARHMVRMMRKQNPKSLIVATGCYVQRAAEDLIKAGADMVIDNSHKSGIPELINKERPVNSSINDINNNDHSPSRVRSFIKIQDGCRHFCTYCIVPYVRQMEYCIPVEEVINTVTDRVSQGYKEVVLTGTEIGRYRDNDIDIAGLTAKILGITELERLHLSSLQPQGISGELLSLWSDARLSRHFHLALQSGSDTVLNRMRREYNTDKYQEAVSQIRQYLPDAAITTDIMVGFPGESDEEFEDSYNFCSNTGFAGIHVFSYSPRPGTGAAKMPEQVDDKIKKSRSRRMLALAKESADDCRRGYLGKTMQILFENEVAPGSGLYSGLSENYIRVFAKSRVPLTGSMVPVKLIRLYHHDVRGEIVK
jgi:threonylcarbamoyladenosine tRNA methylthiotransferase MtaB